MERAVTPHMRELPRPGKIFIRQYGGGWAPGDRLAGDEQALREMHAHLLDVMQNRDDGARLSMPAAKNVHEVGGRALIDCGERLIEENDPRILNQEAGEKDALQLPDRQRPDRAIVQPLKTGGSQCLMDADLLLARDGAECASLLPQAEGDRIPHIDRESPVDIGLLRQITDLLSVVDAERNPSVIRPQHPDDGFEECALPRSVRSDDCGQAARLESAAQVMDRRLAVIGDGQILDADPPIGVSVSGFEIHWIAQATASHRRTSATPRISSLVDAAIRRGELPSIRSIMCSPY